MDVATDPMPVHRMQLLPGSHSISPNLMLLQLSWARKLLTILLKAQVILCLFSFRLNKSMQPQCANSQVAKVHQAHAMHRGQIAEQERTCMG